MKSKIKSEIVKVVKKKSGPAVDMGKDYTTVAKMPKTLTVAIKKQKKAK